MSNTAIMQKDIETLRGITEISEGGITRIGFTSKYREAVDYIKTRMHETGLCVREDSIGNFYGKMIGKDMNAPSIVSGSHLDTVHCAGAFDGVAGVVCALEAARMLKENQINLRHSYEVLALIEEEGTRFGQVLLGSQFLTGDLGDKDLDAISDEAGNTLRQVLRTYLPSNTWPVYRAENDIMAFIELHDEQGPVLEAKNIDIGIVENIVAIAQLKITVNGFAGHAGTVPMLFRKDAALGACRLIDRINAFTLSGYADRAVLTIGHIELFPGSVNTIASKCVFSVDIRSGQFDCIEEMTGYIHEQADKISAECNVKIEVKTMSVKQPVCLDPEIRRFLQEACEGRGYSYCFINSGAGHDAMVMARRWKTGMIFIPCVKGITHNPQEEVHPQALEKGADLLYEALIRIDKASL